MQCLITALTFHMVLQSDCGNNPFSQRFSGQLTTAAEVQKGLSQRLHACAAESSANVYS